MLLHEDNLIKYFSKLNDIQVVLWYFRACGPSPLHSIVVLVIIAKIVVMLKQQNLTILIQ